MELNESLHRGSRKLLQVIFRLPIQNHGKRTLAESAPVGSLEFAPPSKWEKDHRVASLQLMVLYVALLTPIITAIRFSLTNFWRRHMQLTKADYHLPSLGPKIVALGKEASLGRGFQLLRQAHVIITSWRCFCTYRELNSIPAFYHANQGWKQYCN
jgi:hypothetical protein